MYVDFRKHKYVTRYPKQNDKLTLFQPVMYWEVPISNDIN